MKHTFKSLIKKIIIEQSESQEYAEISAQEFKDLAKLASYNLNVVSKMKRFGGKKIKVIGDLDLSDVENLNSLGNLAVVVGRFDISGTKVSDLSKLEEVTNTLVISNTPIKKHDNVKTRYVNDYNSLGYKIRLRMERQRKLGDADSRRQDGEWDLEVNPDSRMAKLTNALFNHLVKSDEIQVLNNEEEEELKNLEARQSQLEAQYEQNENQEIANEIEEIESRVFDLKSKKVDVYNLIPSRYTHYGIQQFEVVTEDSDVGMFAVGTELEFDNAIREYWENFINENQYEGFRRGTLEDFLDTDRIYDDAYSEYDTDIRDNLDSYFDESNKDLSRSQAEEITKLKKEKDELEVRLDDLEPEDEGHEEITNRIQEIDVEIDEIEDSPDGEVKEEDIEEKIEQYANDAKEDPLQYINDRGYDVTDYVDNDEFIDYLVNSDGYGPMNGYDGEYDVEYLDNQDYYIMKLDG
jgi:hypothetical protein